MSDEDDVLTVLALCDRLRIESVDVRADMIAAPELAIAILRHVKRARGIHNPAAYATARFASALRRRDTTARARPQREADELVQLVAAVAPAPPRLADLELAWSLAPSVYRTTVVRCMAAAIERHGGLEACAAYLLGETDEPPPRLQLD